ERGLPPRGTGAGFVPRGPRLYHDHRPARARALAPTPKTRPPARPWSGTHAASYRASAGRHDERPSARSIRAGRPGPRETPLLVARRLHGDNRVRVALAAGGFMVFRPL